MTRHDDREPGRNGPDQGDALDRQLDAVLHDLKRSYRVPRAEPPLDAMWGAIEATLPASGADVVPFRPRVVATGTQGRRLPRYAQWIGIAATLLVGVGLGRLSVRPTEVRVEVPVAAATGSDLSQPRPRPGPERQAPSVEVPEQTLARLETPRQASPRSPDVTPVIAAAASGAGDEYMAESPTSTGRFLGQTTALIVSLANDAPRPGDDARFSRRARELLVTTRLMMDAPTTDEKSRALLEDLELVLTQIVRLQGEQGRQELALIREALEQRELLPRLYSAVVEGGDD